MKHSLWFINSLAGSWLRSLCLVLFSRGGRAYVLKLNNVLNNALVTTQVGHILRNVSCLVTLA